MLRSLFVACAISLAACPGRVPAAACRCPGSLRVVTTSDYVDTVLAESSTWRPWRRPTRVASMASETCWATRGRRPGPRGPGEGLVQRYPGADLSSPPDLELSTGGGSNPTTWRRAWTALRLQLQLQRDRRLRRRDGGAPGFHRRQRLRRARWGRQHGARDDCWWTAIGSTSPWNATTTPPGAFRLLHAPHPRLRHGAVLDERPLPPNARIWFDPAARRTCWCSTAAGSRRMAASCATTWRQRSGGRAPGR